jgi:hypothetical protein
LVIVRGLLTWLMVLGVFAGLSSRVLAIGHSHEHGHDHASEHGSPCHGHEEPAHDEPATDCPSDCPPGEHHHHHACCVPLQLAVDPAAGYRLPVPESFLVGLLSLNLVPPDGPVFDLDKPPLI